MAGRVTIRVEWCPEGAKRVEGHLLVAFVYILRCSDGTFYIGQTANLEARVIHHNNGLGSSYTARRLPVTLVHSETLPTHAAARARERQLKRWSAEKKAALIAGDRATLKALSKRRQKPGTQSS